MLKTVDLFKNALQKIESGIKINHHKIRNFAPNVRFTYERGNYLLKTAEHPEELAEALRLRFEVFFKELLNKSGSHGVDVDRMDMLCDHLLIIDKREHKIVGTYRLNCSLFSDTLYSTSEFVLDKLLEQTGTKLEIGRACIHKDHRNGAIITMLWRGLVEYIKKTDTKYMFGCGSIHTTDAFEAALIYKHLRDRGHVSHEFGIRPTKKYAMPDFEGALDYIETCPARFNQTSVEKLVPGLMLTYFKAGSKVHGVPAIDHSMHCIDFLTNLEVEKMNPLFKRKYDL